jgi:hypothetical protein
MATAGVPANVRALWHGRTQAGAVDTYTHARPQDLALAAPARWRRRITAVREVDQRSLTP